MRRLIGAALAALLCFAPLTAHAASRIVVYPGQQPLSEQQNQQVRFHRLSFGTWMRDALGSNTSAAGVYSNLSVVPNGGMYVQVQPTQANTLGSLYQIGVDDSSPVPAGSTWNPTIAADSTKIVLQGLQSAPSGSLGPIVAPNTGLSQYYLVEAQLQTVDASSQSITFVNSNRTTSTQTVNTQRVDEIVYQLKAGVAQASPTAPTVDTGWIAVATVLVPSGTSTITSGMISAEPAFSGFVANGSNVTVSGLTLSGASAGCLQTNSSGVVSSQTCTSGLGTVSGTSPISASTSAGVATISCPSCVTSVSASGNLSSSGGTTPSISLSANPGFTSVTANSTTTNGNATIPNSGTATSSTNYGALGAFQVEASLWNGSSAALHTWAFTADNAGKLSFQFDSAPKFTVDSSGNAVATTFTGSGAGLTNLPLNQFSGLTSGRCLRASSSTTIASASADCVTGLTAGTGISVGTGTTPTVSIANNGVGQSQVANGYVDLSSAQNIGGAKTFTNNITNAAGGYACSSSTSVFGSTGGCALQAGGSLGGVYFQAGCQIANGQADYVDGSTGTLNVKNCNGSSVSTFGPNGASVNGAIYSSGQNGVEIGYGTQTPYQNAESNLAIQFPNVVSSTGSTFIGSNGLASLGGVTCASLLIGNYAGSNDICADGSGNIGVGGYISSAISNNSDFIRIPGATYNASWGTSTSLSAQGIVCEIMCVNWLGNQTLFTVNHLGNVGVSGNVTAANFFNGSKRAWKKNITPYRFDPLDVLMRTDFAEYDCKTNRCGPVGEHKVGIIADDSPWQVAGKHHDRYDGFAMAAIAGKAVTELNLKFEHLSHRVDGLEAMVHRLCREKKNRKEAVCRAFAH